LKVNYILEIVYGGGVTQWVARPYCLVLVDSRNGFERDFTIELK